MRLAIADPPYLGRGARLYGSGANGRVHLFDSKASRNRKGWKPTPLRTTEHPDARSWDDPRTHTGLVAHLVANFDGWAIAAAADSLAVYLPACPTDAKVCPWVQDRPIPSRDTRIITGWEAVIVYVPPDRRRRGTGPAMRGVLHAGAPNVGHVGAKPDEWTRFVLNLLGYDADIDTVDDLFPGSGRVARVIAQGQLL